MKRSLISFLVLMLLMVQQSYSQQQKQIWLEDFDGVLPPTNWDVDPQGTWIPNTVYYLPGSSATNPKSYMGFVPNRTGDSTILETDIYDCSPYKYVMLRFNHICKLAITDAARIEYRVSMGTGMGKWEPLLVSTYQGNATNYSLGFNAASYPSDWKSTDNAAFPTSSWWKEELFDLQHEAGYLQVQFRFIIKRGNTAGTQLAYGWLLENFELLAGDYPLNPPTVQLLTPLVRDTVYRTGPFEINAKVKTNSNTPIENPFLKYTATQNGLFIASDSIQMIHVQGDSLWTTIILQFEAGTKITYSVTGKDSLSNKTTVNQEFIITMPEFGSSGDVIVGTGTVTNNQTPMATYYQNSWTRQIYLASELSEASIGGRITHLAWDFGYTGGSSFTLNNQRCYFKAVDDVVCVTGYVDPASDGATLVWQGSFTCGVGRTWAEILLTTPFTLPPGKNLMIYWISEHGPGYPGSAYVWNHTTMATNMAIYAQADAAGLPVTSTGTLSTARANARFAIASGNMLDYSASIASIDMAMDTINIEPDIVVPLVVTLQNKGRTSLTSATLSYSINGGTPKDTLIAFSPAIPWDYRRQVTVGNFTPYAGQMNDIEVWIKLPNGQYDSTTYDDTLTKRIYGKTDLIMQFTQTPADTVYTTGPHEIRAEVYTVSGASLLSSPSLYVTSTRDAVTSYDTLPMQAIDARTWTVEIPKMRYGADVTYTLKGSDTIGNEIELTGSFYVKQQITAYSGYVIVGTGTVTNNQTPMATYYQNSWTRQIYLASELSEASNGGEITHLAWDFGYTGGNSFTLNNQRCYFKAVDDVVCVTGYVDPASDGATLVWQGSFTCGVGRTWAEILLTTPFTLPPGKNLMIYWISEHGPGYPGSAYVWNHTTMATNMAIYAQADAAGLPVTSAGTLSTARANARFAIKNIPLANSVALTAINSPGKSAITGIPESVQVTIQNKGYTDMDSCQIDWMVNGVPMLSTTYNRLLYSDFSDTITLRGFYTPTLGKLDTIIVTVSLPNGIADSNTIDDKLMVITLGCSEPLKGIIPVGAGEVYTTISDVLKVMRNCGVGGDITLSLKNDVYEENIDLTDIQDDMQNYSLTIQSASGNRDSVIIRPEADRVVILGNSHNITFKNITLNGNTTSQNVVEFAQAVNNIVFDNCVIRGSRTTSSSSNANCIQKSSNAGFTNITIKHCLIDGGYNGVNISMADATGRGRAAGIVIDSNTFVNQYYYGIYGNYLRPQSISYNTITPRTASQGTTWRGIYVYEIRNVAGICRIAGNKITASNPEITSTLGGIYISYADTILIANNEIRLNSSAGTTHGIYVEYPYGINVFHNSVLLTGTGGSTAYRALHFYTTAATTYSGTVKNNIFAAIGGAAASTYAAYLPTSVSSYQDNYQFDYNNYFSSGTNLGYAGTARLNLLAWQTNMPADTHSVDFRPSFTDSLTDLKLKSYANRDCPVLPEVTEDRAGNERIKITTMGAYDGLIRTDKDAALIQILGLDDGVGANQTQYVDVVVQNKGWDTLKTIELEWFIDGNSIATLSRNVSVGLEDSDTLSLGSIPLNYTIGSHTLMVVIKEVNNVPDQQPANDTIEMFYLSCSIPVTGTVRIGASDEADYPDFAAAFLRLRICGISGKVTLQLEDTTFTESVDFSKLSLTNNDTLELISLSGNTDSTIIKTDVFGIKTGDWNNIYIKNITVNLTGEGHGILLGSGDNIEISGCKINLDTTLARNLSTGTTHVAIYKPENSGVANNVRILNNVISGGYNGILVDGGTDTNTYATDWILDGNTIQKIYWQSALIYYTDFLSISKNTFTPLITNTATGWNGLTMSYCNAQIIQGNKIHGQRYAFTNPRGMFFDYLNNGITPVEIYNNEIILSRTGSTTTVSAPFIFQNSSGKIYHNSIYVSETATSATYYYSAFLHTADADVKNNNIVSTHSPIYVNTPSGVITTADYNNYYTGGTNIGYLAGTAVADLTTWKNISGQDANSVSVRPKFLNLQQSTAMVDSFVYVVCPVLSAVPSDINNTPRQYTLTAMGAHELTLPDTSAVWLSKLVNFPTEAIVQQQYFIDVEVSNFSKDAIDSILFAYSFNNGTPLTYLWRPSTPVAPLSNAVTVRIGSLNVVGDTAIKVWIAQANGVANRLKDTVSGAYKVIHLAEFVAPLAKDTLFNKLSVDVNVRISALTGAPVTPPQLHITREDYDGTSYDIIPMTANGEIWTAPLSPKYYNTKISYWLSVADNIGNSVTLMDSVYIVADIVGGGGDGIIDTVIIGTGTSTTNANPYMYNYNYTYSRNYYLAREIDPQQRGGTILSIAFYKTSTATSNVDNVSFYLKAVTDSANTSTAYIDPIADGATLVWGSATASATGIGWLTFNLNTPFDLPAGMNLLVYCDDLDGSYSGNGDATFRYTAAHTNSSVYVYYDGTAFQPPTATIYSYMNNNRPNIKITKEGFEPYSYSDLALSSLSPVNSSDISCEETHLPVQVHLANLGANDYDFTSNSISLYYEVTDPLQTIYSGTLSIDTSGLASGKSTVIELIPSIPILAGTTTIKAWLNNPDQITYDDTVIYTYLSTKLALPINEYFSGSVMPFEFRSIPDNANGWQVYHPNSDFPVQPDSAGTGILRFAGSVGSVAKLSTSYQIDMYGTVNPTLDFWYYHDSTLSELDNSYIDVNIIEDGISTTEISNLLKRSKQYHGWKQYTVNLSPYTTAQCVLIEFEAMNKFAGSEQYIDHIYITSDNDLELTEIIVSPQITTCDLKNKNISVVIMAKTAQAIDFTEYSTSLAVEIPGRPIDYIPLQNVLEGRTSDTIPIASGIDFPLVSNDIKVYLTAPVDVNPLNDIITKTIDINPKFNIRIHAISQSGNPALAEFEHNQVITITNTGNMELPGIGFVLTVDTVEGKPSYFTRTITFNQNISPGDSVDDVTFDAFTVPWSFDYFVKVRGYLLCDPAIIDTTVSVHEYVDMNDLYMLSIEKPLDDGEIHRTNSMMGVEVKIKNRNPRKAYDPGEARVVILLTDTNGNPIDVPIIEELPDIAGGEEIHYIFGEEYRVPMRSKYRLNVFIEKVDQYTKNDTLKMIYATDHDVSTTNVSKSSFTMEQNIPNPAKGNTIINYSIPQDGEIVFQLYSISGQILYNKKETVFTGNNQIELNISDYASGIYFYTMEYKGQRITKRMSIKR